MSTKSCTMPKRVKPVIKKEHIAITNAKESLKPKIKKPITKEIVIKEMDATKEPEVKVLGRWRDLSTGDMRDATNLYLDRLAITGTIWSLRPDSIHINDFCREIKMSRDSLDNFSSYQPIKDALTIMKKHCASNRETGAIRGELSTPAVLAFQGMRDEEYKEFLRWKEEIRKDTRTDNKVEVTIRRIDPLEVEVK